MSKKSKIILCDDLPSIRKKHAGEKIVLSHGTWDVIHPGILGHLEEAKSQGDILVVTLTADDHISKKRYIAFSEELRAGQMASLDLVDYVSIVYEPSAITAIKMLEPDVYVKGSIYKELLIDSSKNIYREKEQVESYGGSVYFTTHEMFSSVKVSHFLMESPEALQQSKSYFGPAVRFKDISDYGFHLDDVRDFLDSIKGMKACVIGDCIIDEWKYLKLHSISQKSKCMCGEERNRKRQVGGAGIVALDISDFVETVDFYSNECGIWENRKNINYFSVTDGELVKTRFVNSEDEKVLFESKVLSAEASSGGPFAGIDYGKYDIVLIADFGHGLISDPARKVIIDKCPPDKLACMVQANSSNFGFNTPMKFPEAAYYSMNKIEAELCLRSKDLPGDELFTMIGELIKADSYAITFGADGAIVRTGQDIVRLPALSQVIVDNLGCGDAFFALSALGAVIKKDAALANLLGSLGSAIMSQRHGNDMPVTAGEVLRLAEIVV